MKENTFLYARENWMFERGSSAVKAIENIVALSAIKSNTSSAIVIVNEDITV